MALHVTGAEATSAIKFLERAFSKHSAKIAAEEKMLAEQARLKKKRPVNYTPAAAAKMEKSLKPVAKPSKNSLWLTREQYEKFERAIAERWPLKTMVDEFPFSRSVCYQWRRLAISDPNFLRSRLKDATPSSEPPVSDQKAEPNA